MVSLGEKKENFIWVQFLIILCNRSRAQREEKCGGYNELLMAANLLRFFRTDGQTDRPTRAKALQT